MKQTAIVESSRRGEKSAGGLLARIVFGLGAACGIACLLALIVTALGLSGAAVLAATFREVDEWLFCSPFGAWMLGALSLGALIFLRRRAYRSRERTHGGCCEHGSASTSP